MKAPGRASLDPAFCLVQPGIPSAVASKNVSAEIAPAHGMVSSQAMSMRLATPQRTALSFVTLPTPMIAPAIVWVVETGMPSFVAMNSVNAPLVSAAKPPTGWSLATPIPSVRTMRQPPVIVPSAIAA